MSVEPRKVVDEGIALRAVGPDSLLARLSGPSDLKGLSSAELTQLAETYATARYGARRSSTHEFQTRIRRLRLSRLPMRRA